MITIPWKRLSLPVERMKKYKYNNTEFQGAYRIKKIPEKTGGYSKRMLKDLRRLLLSLFTDGSGQVRIVDTGIPMTMNGDNAENGKIVLSHVFGLFPINSSDRMNVRSLMVKASIFDPLAHPALDLNI